MKTSLLAASLLLLGAGNALAQPVPPTEPPPAPPAAEPAPPAAEPAPAPPPPVVEPAPAPPTPPPAAKEASPLVPSWEAARVASRPISPKIAFRPGKGLTIASEDGDFEAALKVRGQILATFATEHTDDGETESGAQIRRARFAMQGHMFGAHNKYKLELAVSPRDVSSRGGATGTSPLLDWYMTFDYLPEATIVAGQYKVPYNRQRVVSSGSLQMVDRSIVQGEFNLDRNVGFDVRSTSLLDHRLNYYAGFYMGEGRNAFESRQQNFLYLARVEVLPFGKFSHYIEGDFERTGPRLAIGASYAYDKDSARDQGPLGSPPADEGTTSFHMAEADVLFKAYGFSVMAEAFWRDGKRDAGDAVDDMGNPIPAEPPRDGLGFFGQAGYLLPRSGLELSARYGNIMAASEDTSLADRQELGVGVSYYFAHHTMKLQADAFRLWGDSGIDDGTDQVRVQLEAGL